MTRGKRTNSKKLIAEIGNSVDKEDLIPFIQAYAKKNKKFELEFRIHFASKFGGQDDYYDHLMHDVLRALKATSSDLKLKRQDVLFVLKQIKNLLHQAQDRYALDDFQEAFVIGKTCLKTIISLSYYHPSHQVYDTLWEELHEFLWRIYEKTPAKDLKDDILIFVKEHLGEHPYPLLSRDYNLITFYQLYGNKPEENILSILHAHLANNQLTPFKFGYEELLLQSHAANKRDSLLQEQLEKLQYDKEYYDIVLRNVDNLSKIEAYFETLREKYYKIERLSLKKAIFQILITFYQDRDLEQTQKLYEDMLLQHFDMVIYENYLTRFPKNHRTDLFEDAFSKGDLDEKRNLANLYATYDDTDKLMHWIKQCNSVVLLNEYVSDLYDDHPNEVLELYKEKIAEHLRTHIGPRAKQWVRSLLLHLDDPKTKKLLRKLENWISKEYPSKLGITSSSDLQSILNLL